MDCTEPATRPLLRHENAKKKHSPFSPTTRFPPPCPYFGGLGVSNHCNPRPHHGLEHAKRLAAYRRPVVHYGGVDAGSKWQKRGIERVWRRVYCGCCSDGYRRVCVQTTHDRVDWRQRVVVVLRRQWVVVVLRRQRVVFPRRQTSASPKKRPCRVSFCIRVCVVVCVVVCVHIAVHTGQHHGCAAGRSPKSQAQ